MENERRRASLIRECPSCHTKNRIPPEHLAETGQCGKCKAPLPPVAEPIEADAELFDSVTGSAAVPVAFAFFAPDFAAVLAFVAAGLFPRAPASRAAPSRDAFATC